MGCGTRGREHRMPFSPCHPFYHPASFQPGTKPYRNTGLVHRLLSPIQDM
jgi:hypothetical protein